MEQSRRKLKISARTSRNWFEIVAENIFERKKIKRN